MVCPAGRFPRSLRTGVNPSMTNTKGATSGIMS